MVFSFRTLFLFIRGIDQTGRALTDPTKKLTDMEKAQQRLAQSGYRLIFAGAAFMAFGAMAAGALMRVIEKSSVGARVMDDFGKAMDRFQRGLSEAILKNYGEQIKGILKTITDWTTNPQTLDITAKLAVTGITGTLALGAALIFFGGLKMFLSALLPYLNLSSAAGEATVTAAGSIVIPIIITLVVKDILTLFLPETQAKMMSGLDSIMELWKRAQEGKLELGLTPNAGSNLADKFRLVGKTARETAVDNNQWLKAAVTIYQYITGTPTEIVNQVKDSTIEGITDSLGAIP
jgi:hypothetical protein